MNLNRDFFFDLDLPEGQGRTLAWGALRLELLAQSDQLWAWNRWVPDCGGPEVKPWPGRPRRLAERWALPGMQRLRAQVCLPISPLLLRFDPPVTVAPQTIWSFSPVVPLWVCLYAGETALGSWAAHPVRRSWVGPDTRQGELGFALDAGPAPGAPLTALGRVTAHNPGKQPLHLKHLIYPIHRLGLGGSAQEPRFGAARWSFENPKQGQLQLDKPPSHPLLPPTQVEANSYRNLMPALLK